MNFFYLPNTYSAQIEGTGLSFRFGYTCFGVSPSASFWHRRTIDLPKWYRLLFGWHFAFFCHTGQSGRWYIFKIDIGAIQFWYKTIGEGKDEYTGLHIAFRGLREWRLII